LFNPNVIESRVFEKVDAVVFVGVDAMMTHAPWKLTLPTCELAARPNYSTMSKPTARVTGDLKQLLKQLSGSPRQGISTDEIEQIRRGILSYFARPAKACFAAQDIIEIIRENLPEDGLMISETGAFVCMLEHLWKVESPGTFMGTSGGRTMGLMVPAALGARLADEKTPMVGLGADGSLLMRLGELEAFARRNISVPLVIINDHALGTMKARQKSKGYADHGLAFQSVNFAAIAEACGLHGVVTNSPEAFRKEFSKVLKSDLTTLIDARVDPEAYQDSFSPTIGDLSSFHVRSEAE
jgi:acetolactate synthase I/II/III large subunit